MRRTVIALSDVRSEGPQPTRDKLLEALSRDGFCFVESPGSSDAVNFLLTQLARFFGGATPQEKGHLKAYLWGLLRGYFPPLEPDSRKLERRKERYVLGNRNNLFPGNYPLLELAYNNLYTRHIQRIADAVYSILHGYLCDTHAQWAADLREFFLNPYSGELDPGVLSYAMHYPAIDNPEQFADADQTITISDPHVDMTTFTILPRGTSGATQMFNESGGVIPIYDSSIPPDAVLVFVGKTLERLLDGIPFQNRNGCYAFKAFRHTVRSTFEEVSKNRDVVGFFFNGNSHRRYITIGTAMEFGSMFIDRRPLHLKRREPLPGAGLTIKDRQYLTEQLFFSDNSPNSASPPVSLEQFRSVN